nr:hypothetical protein [Cohnella sp. CFH 77786]
MATAVYGQPGSDREAWNRPPRIESTGDRLVFYSDSSDRVLLRVDLE